MCDTRRRLVCVLSRDGREVLGQWSSALSYRSQTARAPTSVVTVANRQYVLFSSLGVLEVYDM